LLGGCGGGYQQSGEEDGCKQTVSEEHL
jgi:hypothetical protein